MKPARDRPFWCEVAVVLIIGQVRTASAKLRRSPRAFFQEIFAGASRGESTWTMSNAIK